MKNEECILAYVILILHSERSDHSSLATPN